jgi:hypothetical protein
LAIAAGCESATYADDVSGARARYLTATDIVVAEVATPPLAQYEDAPRSPDADDPAIWVHPERDGEGLVVTALKDAGLAVYDLRGHLVQTILPPHRAPLATEEPPTIGAQPELGTTACPDSATGTTYSRFNNVDVYYGMVLRGESAPVDIAVATDRGCDRLRIYRIDPERAGGPLFDITANGKAASRVFPKRYVQPWTLGGRSRARVEKNPVDDQSTAYGLTLYAPEDGALRAFVTQRSRATLAELELFDAGRGRVGYRHVREYRFPTVFSLRVRPGDALRGRLAARMRRTTPNSKGWSSIRRRASCTRLRRSSGSGKSIWRAPPRATSFTSVSVSCSSLFARSAHLTGRSPKTVKPLARPRHRSLRAAACQPASSSRKAMLGSAASTSRPTPRAWPCTISTRTTAI